MTSTQQSPLSRSSWKRCHFGAKRQSPKSVQARHKHCAHVVHPQQQSSRTSSARSLLQWRSHRAHEQTQIPRDQPRQNADVSTELRCKKGLSALKAMASKGIEQRHVYLLYQSVILSVIDYGLGLKTLSQSNLLKLDRVQNEAMRVVLGTTKDAPIETMRYLLNLPSMETKHKVEQVKAYLNAMQNTKNPLRDAVKEEKGCRLAWGESWMGPASIQDVCSLAELKQVRDLEKRPAEFKPYYKTLLSENLGTHYLEWPIGKANVEVQMVVEANSKPHDIVIYTDGSVTRDRSGLGFTVKQGGKSVHEDSGAHRVMTSSLTMEVEAVTHAIQWLAAQITYAIILTFSMNLMQKVSGMGCPDWHTAMHSLRLRRPLWIYCPGHAGVSGNERADRLASTADITSCLQLGRAEALQGLRNFLNMDRAEHHSTDRLKVRSGERNQPTFHPPRSRTICLQPGKYWHYFEGNLGETAERQGGTRIGLSERCDAILSWN